MKTFLQTPNGRARGSERAVTNVQGGGAQVTSAPYHRGEKDAFTLIELLTVLAIICILAALLLPALAKAKPQAQRVACLNNLHQVGVAAHTFAHDHDGNFPMQVGINSGGVMELVPTDAAFGELFQAFGAMGNELRSPKVLSCPADAREPASAFSRLAAHNVSYFVGLQSKASDPWSVLGGNRNFHLTNSSLAWTNGLHNFRGNLLFADAHAEKRQSWTPPPMVLTTLILPGGTKSAGPQMGRGHDLSAPPSDANSPNPNRDNFASPARNHSPTSPAKEMPTAKAAPDNQPMNSAAGNPGSFAPGAPSEPDDDFTSPNLKFFKRLFLFGWAMSALWALGLLGAYVAKKVRDRRALMEEARQWHAARLKAP